MKKVFILVFGLLMVSNIHGQETIDGTINFQTDPAKKYSLYIPSGYDAAVANPAFLCLHPLNTRRWDGQSWRDTLITFAETNDLVLISPDGGADGRIDDAIDTAFTTFLLDSMFRAYNLDVDALYVVGFSWGGRTTYTYGLSNPSRFKGFMPIGAAINGTTEIDPVIAGAEDQAFFVIHGDRDIPGTRFTPAVQALNNNNACVRDTLMPGITHTIDFPGRNDLLTMGYNWLKAQNCGSTSSEDVSIKEVAFTPNPLSLDAWIAESSKLDVIKVIAMNGQALQGNRILGAGSYVVYHSQNGKQVLSRVVIVD